MSKGSKRRPQAVADKTVADNWERIFGKRKHLAVSGTLHKR